jgi:putative hemolysin
MRMNESGTDLRIEFAATRQDLLAAQRLRYQVFAEEFGADLGCQIPGVDADIFDAYCDHLLVRDRQSLEVVGTYRMLRPEQARALGCSYADSEFDLSGLAAMRPWMAELGRSCVAPGYRNGATIRLLWSGIGRFIQSRGYRYLIGCASVSTRDGGHAAASLYTTLLAHQSSGETWGARPHKRLPLESLRCDLEVAPPPLIKGYLRCGGRIIAEPAWDTAFGTADFLMMLDLSTMSPRYARHFFGDTPASLPAHAAVIDRDEYAMDHEAIAA